MLHCFVHQCLHVVFSVTPKGFELRSAWLERAARIEHLVIFAVDSSLMRGALVFLLIALRCNLMQGAVLLVQLSSAITLDAM